MFRFRHTATALAAGDGVPDYDFDWATIGDPGNKGWSGEIPFIENGAGRSADDYTFTDQLTRNPDAKFWIPSLDEWIKAVHYDPNRNGEGEGGYWCTRIHQTPR